MVVPYYFFNWKKCSQFKIGTFQIIQQKSKMLPKIEGSKYVYIDPRSQPHQITFTQSNRPVGLGIEHTGESYYGGSNLNDGRGNQQSQYQVKSSAKYSCTDGKAVGKSVKEQLSQKHERQGSGQVNKGNTLKWVLIGLGLLLLVAGIVVGSYILMKQKSETSYQQIALNDTQTQSTNLDVEDGKIVIAPTGYQTAQTTPQQTSADTKNTVTVDGNGNMNGSLMVGNGSMSQTATNTTNAKNNEKPKMVEGEEVWFLDLSKEENVMYSIPSTPGTGTNSTSTSRTETAVAPGLNTSISTQNRTDNVSSSSLNSNVSVTVTKNDQSTRNTTEIDNKTATNITQATSNKTSSNYIQPVTAVSTSASTPVSVQPIVTNPTTSISKTTNSSPVTTVTSNSSSTTIPTNNTTPVPTNNTKTIPAIPKNRVPVSSQSTEQFWLQPISVAPVSVPPLPAAAHLRVWH